MQTQDLAVHKVAIDSIIEAMQLMERAINGGLVVESGDLYAFSDGHSMEIRTGYLVDSPRTRSLLILCGGDIVVTKAGYVYDWSNGNLHEMIRDATKYLYEQALSEGTYSKEELSALSKISLVVWETKPVY